MKMNSFDPYDALVELNERLLRLEEAHNNLAHAYEKSEHDLSVTMDALLGLQKSHLALTALISNRNNELE